MIYTKEQAGRKTIGTLEMAKLFGNEYIRQNAIGAAESISEELMEKHDIFLDLRAIHLVIDRNMYLRGVQFGERYDTVLGFKLPCGERMEKPIAPIPYTS